MTHVHNSISWILVFGLELKFHLFIHSFFFIYLFIYLSIYPTIYLFMITYLSLNFSNISIHLFSYLIPSQSGNRIIMYMYRDSSRMLKINHDFEVNSSNCFFLFFLLIFLDIFRQILDIFELISVIFGQDWDIFE